MKPILRCSAIGFVILSGCATQPQLPADLAGNAAIVMGFATDSAQTYEGGTLYTGLILESINGEPLEPGLRRYEYRLTTPGAVTVTGHCFWRLRGIFWEHHADLWEPGSLSWQAEPNHVYTLSADIDEYKNRCVISLFDGAPQS